MLSILAVVVSLALLMFLAYRGVTQHRDAPVGSKHEEGQGNNEGEDDPHEVGSGAAAHACTLQ